MRLLPAIVLFGACHARNRPLVYDDLRPRAHAPADDAFDFDGTTCPWDELEYASFAGETLVLNGAGFHGGTPRDRSRLEAVFRACGWDDAIAPAQDWYRAVDGYTPPQAIVDPVTPAEEVAGAVLATAVAVALSAAGAPPTKTGRWKRDRGPELVPEVGREALDRAQNRFGDAIREASASD